MTGGWIVGLCVRTDVSRNTRVDGAVGWVGSDFGESIGWEGTKSGGTIVPRVVRRGPERRTGARCPDGDGGWGGLGQDNIQSTVQRAVCVSDKHTFWRWWFTHRPQSDFSKAKFETMVLGVLGTY